MRDGKVVWGLNAITREDWDKFGKYGPQEGWAVGRNAEFSGAGADVRGHDVHVVPG